MRWLCRSLILVAVVFLVAGSSIQPAEAAETAASDIVIIRDGVIVNDDLYASGLKVIIEGEVHGDLFAAAAEEVVITGTVTGGVFAVAQNVEVSGQVGGSLRVAASSLDIAGDVGRDLVVAAVSVVLDRAGSVGGDAIIWALNANLAGTIVDNLAGTCRSMELAGSVGGDVDVTVGRFEVSGPLTVGGDLAYRSRNEAAGVGDAVAGGVIVKETPLPPNVRVRALGLLGRILIVLGLTATAILVAFGWPEAIERGSRALRSHPLRSFVIGLAIMCSPLIVLGIAALIVALAPAAVSLPLLAVIIPVAIAMGGLILALAMVAGAPAVLTLGRWMRKSLGLYGAIAAGAALVGFVWLIPLVGWLVPLTVPPVGMGSLALALRARDVRSEA